MSQRTGKVPGDDAQSCVIAIAGCLAELGVQELVVTDADGQSQHVLARTTNLPQLVMQMLQHAELSNDQRVVVIEAGSLGAAFEMRGLTPSNSVWTCGEPHMAARIESLLRTRAS